MADSEEDTRRFITYGYYYRDYDWNGDQLIKYTPIGWKYPTVEDFYERSTQDFLKDKEEII